MNDALFDIMPNDSRLKILTPRVCRVRGLSQLLGVSEASIRRWADEGSIPCAKIGGVRLFVPMDVIRALRSQY